MCDKAMAAATLPTERPADQPTGAGVTCGRVSRVAWGQVERTAHAMRIVRRRRWQLHPDELNQFNLKCSLAFSFFCIRTNTKMSLLPCRPTGRRVVPLMRDRSETLAAVSRQHAVAPLKCCIDCDRNSAIASRRRIFYAHTISRTGLIHFN